MNFISPMPPKTMISSNNDALHWKKVIILIFSSTLSHLKYDLTQRRKGAKIIRFNLAFLAALRENKNKSDKVELITIHNSPFIIHH